MTTTGFTGVHAQLQRSANEETGLDVQVCRIIMRSCYAFRPASAESFLYTHESFQKMTYLLSERITLYCYTGDGRHALLVEHGPEDDPFNCRNYPFAFAGQTQW